MNRFSKSIPVGIFGPASVRCIRQRLAMLLMAVFICQVTLPYQTASCPMYQTDHATTKVALTGSTTTLDPNCPMMVSNKSVSFSKHISKDMHKSGGMGFCSLCALALAFVGYVAAGLVSLPPPVTRTAGFFAYGDDSLTALSGQRGFSARAPPSLI